MGSDAEEWSEDSSESDEVEVAQIDDYYIYIGDLRDADDLIGINQEDNPFRVMGLPGKSRKPTRRYNDKVEYMYMNLHPIKLMWPTLSNVFYFICNRRLKSKAASESTVPL